MLFRKLRQLNEKHEENSENISQTSILLNSALKIKRKLDTMK